MNKEEILNKYIALIDKGYCSDCNELNCIDNFPHEKITHAIRELQQQCKKQKEIIDKVAEYIEKHIKYECDDAYNGMQFYSYHLYDFNKQDLLDILKEVE